MTMKGLIIAALGLSTLAATPLDAPTIWEVDENHTEVTFAVKHFFTPVTGKFKSFDVELRYDPEDPAASSVEVAVDVASIDTENDRRDNHLRSGDFFEAESHPRMTFRSTSVRPTGERTLVATGPLTIKGVTREVELPIEILGIQEIPEEMRPMVGGASQVASFRAATTLDRRDFGVGVGDWAATLVVGKDVDVEIVVEAALR